MTSEIMNHMEKITEKLGNYKIYGGGELRFENCPVCQEQNQDNPHFSINTQTGLYKCFSSGDGGHINLLKGFEDLDVYKLAETTKGKIKPKKTPEELTKFFFNGTQGEKPQFQGLNGEWIKYFENRGISKKTAEKINLRVHKVKGLAIPISDGKELIGIKYRGINKKLSAESGSSYNYFINWQTIQGKESLIIVEGEIDLMSAIESGFNNAVSLSGGASNLKAIDHQREWIESFKNLIIAVDNDEAGEKCKRGIIEKLKGSGLKLYEVELGDFKDLNEVLMAKGVEAVKKILGEPKEIMEKIIKTENEKKITAEEIEDTLMFASSEKNPRKRFDLVMKAKDFFQDEYKKIDGVYYARKNKAFIKSTVENFVEKITVKNKMLLRESIIKDMVKVFKYSENTEKAPTIEESYIAFKDVTVNIYTGEIVKNKNQFIRFETDLTYKEVMENNNFSWKNHFYEKMGKEQAEVLGSFCFLSLLEKHNRYILVYCSEGGDGKGTFAETWKEIFLPSENAHIFTPDYFLKSFNLSNILMKDMAFIDEPHKLPVDTLKAVTGTSYTNIELKGQQATEFKTNTSYFLLTNNPIELRTWDKAEKRRFILLKHLVKTEIQNDEIAENLKNSKASLLNFVLTEGRKHYLEKKGHIIYQHQDLQEEYEEINDPLTACLKKNSILCLPEEKQTSAEDLNIFFINHGLEKEWFDLSAYKKGKIIQSITNKKAYKSNSKYYYGLKLK